jgi:hypothetical protein
MASVIPEEGNSRPLPGAAVISPAPARHMALLQLGLYFIVGGIFFRIDAGGFVAPRALKLLILAASALSLRNGDWRQYLLCCGFVFRSGASRARRRSSDFSLLPLSASA